MEEPKLLTPTQIQKNDISALIDGEWKPVRSLTMRRLILWHRFKLAWGVFTGKYDAVRWETNP